MFTESGKHEFFSGIPLIRNEEIYYKHQECKGFIPSEKNKKRYKPKTFQVLKTWKVWTLIIIQTNQFKFNAH